ncbi:MAG: carboxyvinyl-carboxyphosphonate phosphorylmutase [Rhodospirillaceae bacterium]|jgi:2-methylisocitrate lyase-like PEP mutase family enzyme|nr:carboxyvinyl-carboxyphosphonate phosphorylmutase [Rhodospirillaceae bacterium]|tara:strand:- start:380 stop:1237 length:858 start_codon:yes stop_codon:yes gene_type:complete
MSQANKLRKLLADPGVLVLPGCFDALSARLIERAGYPGAFMGGFAVSAARIAMPDLGLISYSEMVDQGRDICAAVDFPVIGDGDTGYGNAVNVQRTVRGYARAGFACVMIEDQVAPKKCGHTEGKRIVGRGEAFGRVQAAVDTRDEGADILIMARTDANATDGMDEAIERCRAFNHIGADITFLEAPRDEDEMKRYCDDVEGPKMANMVEQGNTPFLAPEKLADIGYKIVIYPISLMLAGLRAMEESLASIKGGKHPEALAEFAHLRDVVGFPDYYDKEKKYAAD